MGEYPDFGRHLQIAFKLFVVVSTIYLLVLLAL
jgi:hypothetical protein